MKKIIFFLSFFLSISTYSFSQLSGIYTIGGANPDFANLEQAFDSITQQGLNAPVIFKIRNGTYATRLRFDSIPGESEQNNITIESESGDSSRVILTDTTIGSGFPEKIFDIKTPGIWSGNLPSINATHYLKIKSLTILGKNSSLYSFSDFYNFGELEFESCIIRHKIYFDTWFDNNPSRLRVVMKNVLIDSTGIFRYFHSIFNNSTLISFRAEKSKLNKIEIEGIDSLYLTNTQLRKSSFGGFIGDRFININNSNFDSCNVNAIYPGSNIGIINCSFNQNTATNSNFNISGQVKNNIIKNSNISVIEGDFFQNILSIDSSGNYNNFQSLSIYKGSKAFQNTFYSKINLFCDSSLVYNNNFFKRSYLSGEANSKIFENNFNYLSFGEFGNHTDFLKNQVDTINGYFGKSVGNSGYSYNTFNRNIIKTADSLCQIFCDFSEVKNNIFNCNVFLKGNELVVWNNNFNGYIYLNLGGCNGPVELKYNNMKHTILYFDPTTLSFPGRINFNNYYPAKSNYDPISFHEDPMYIGSIPRSNNPVLNLLLSPTTNCSPYDIDSIIRNPYKTIGANVICINNQNKFINLNCSDSTSLNFCTLPQGLNYSYLWQPSTGLNSNTIKSPNCKPNNSTKYYLTVYDASNPIYVDSVNIIINDAPVAIATYTLNYNSLNTISFKNSSKCSDSYLWDFGDGNYSNLFEPTHNYLSIDSSYNVTFIAYSSTGQTDTVKLIVYTYVSAATGLKDSDDITILNIFPNPAKEFLYLNYNDKIDDLKLSFINMLGKETKAEILEKISSKYIINLNQMASGIYLLKITTKGQLITKKIVVEN